MSCSTLQMLYNLCVLFVEILFFGNTLTVDCIGSESEDEDIIPYSYNRSKKKSKKGVNLYCSKTRPWKSTAFDFNDEAKTTSPSESIVFQSAGLCTETQTSSNNFFVCHAKDLTPQTETEKLKRQNFKRVLIIDDSGEIYKFFI